ncbi:MAG TPA: nickel-binding protein [Steroidobacteraceae bacterium]|jgi:hypothetical protein|nr:nickel-binding protein [Steroidobacteraceae bacterium]
MTVYMVERNLKGIAMSDLAAAQRLVISASNAFAAKGTPMRYIRSTFAPEDGRCMCLFEASKLEDVKRCCPQPEDTPYHTVVGNTAFCITANLVIPCRRWVKCTHYRAGALLSDSPQ